jgi:hypothetical protein
MAGLQGSLHRGNHKTHLEPGVIQLSSIPGSPTSNALVDMGDVVVVTAVALGGLVVLIGVKSCNVRDIRQPLAIVFVPSLLNSILASYASVS